MMKKLCLYIIIPLIGIWYFPLLCCYLFSKRREIIDVDVIRWKEHQPQIYKGIESSIVLFLVTLCLRMEFRKQYIWRLGG